ncbi:hypothetical protein ACHQM5_027510 [Ranunculus cassubicifolius]
MYILHHCLWWGCSLTWYLSPLNRVRGPWLPREFCYSFGSPSFLNVEAYMEIRKPFRTLKATGPSYSHEVTGPSYHKFPLQLGTRK